MRACNFDKVARQGFVLVKAVGDDLDEGGVAGAWEVGKAMAKR